MFLDRVIHFGETLGDKVKDRSVKKNETLVVVPSVVGINVNVVRLNLLFI